MSDKRFLVTFFAKAIVSATVEVYAADAEAAESLASFVVMADDYQVHGGHEPDVFNAVVAEFDDERN